MKLYFFQSDNNYPIETGAVIAENEKQAWELFASASNKYLKQNGKNKDSIEYLKKYDDFRIAKVLPVDKPVAWVGYCSN